ncbi:hypothetical protein E2320_001151 [Naja naja]|nr:hypothetical protein E2320_001151 [Naja naja]
MPGLSLKKKGHLVNNCPARYRGKPLEGAAVSLKRRGAGLVAVATTPSTASAAVPVSVAMEDRPSVFIGCGNLEADKRVSFHRSSQSVIGKNLPVVHSSSSHLSTWPAYEPGQGILQNRKPTSKPLMPISKPRYLEELESYLRAELQALDLTKGKVQELKLQMRICLPLAHLQEKICTLESVNGVLVTASDQCTQQILAFQQQEKIEIAKLKEERLYLLKLIDKMKEEKCSLETQATQLHLFKTFLAAFPRSPLLTLLKEKQDKKRGTWTNSRGICDCNDQAERNQVAKLRKTLAEEYLRYLNECDARKLLLLDLNEMYQDVLEEDTVKLKVALRVARQDLTKAQVDLNTMQANYGDVVPRRDFELQEQKYNDLANKLSILQKDFDELSDEYEIMLDIHKQVAEDRDRYFNDLINVQRTLSVGKTSNQLVDVLLEEIGGGLLRERDTFVGRGRSEKIPPYLRCDGLVRNKKLTKKDVVALLREIWREKIISDQQKGKQSSLSDFFLSFFQKKYGDAAAFDWTYSVYENLKLFRSNEMMALFLNVLTGNVDEGVYHNHLLELNNLLKELTLADTENTGQLTEEQFTLALRTAFPLKTDEEIQELLDAAGFRPNDEEGKTEPLITKLRNQYVIEKQTYLNELHAELGTLVDVRPDDLRAAFCIIDHGLTEQTLESYLSYAFQVPKEQLDPAVSIPIELLMQRLMTGDIHRQGAAQGQPQHAPPSHTAEETDHSGI